MNKGRSQKPERNIDAFIRPHLRSAEEYAPVEPIDALGAVAKKPAEKIIKLDGNENPYGCSPKVKKALAAYPYYHLYPDPEQQELRKALAGYIGVGEEHIVGGAGSDDLIELIVRLFIGPGDKVINCVPTFGMYSFLTGLYGGEVVNVPRDRIFNIDIGAVKKAINKDTRLIFIASPNNPSGNITPREDILSLLESNIIVVVDEAYAEFSGVSLASQVPKRNNLIVLRTFSKWAGLAGLRLGYGIFPSNIARHIIKIKQPYNVNAAAQVAALASLEDLPYLKKTVGLIIKERERLFSKLKELSFLKPYPSRANFILCQVAGKKAKNIHARLKRKGISVRYFDTPLLRSYLRISVGKPAHTDALIKELKAIGEKADE